jgi:chloramphenicol-sensitive protein RarD
VRKTVAVGPVLGTSVETLILAPLSIVWVGLHPSGAMTDDGMVAALLLSSAVVTAAPMICFVSGARRLPLSALGFVQYIAPTLHFALAVGAFGEPFDGVKAGCFAIIWSAISVFAADAWRHRLRPTAKLESE